MRLRLRLWAGLTLLTLVGAPSLSCFVPSQLLDAANRDCCRLMGSQCASKDMTSPNSCCQAPQKQSAQPYIGAKHFDLSPSTGTVVLSSSAAPLYLLALGPTEISDRYYSPPLSPPAVVAVLRI